MTAKSRAFKASTIKRPTPGQLKTVSDDDRAADEVDNCRPSTAMTGIAALRSACFHTMSDLDMPLLLRKRM